jgi:predicted glycoside hydrolase/deacetylase ChbG (UPF0249 family)
VARKLIVNADDFGFTCDVNQGILDSHHDGILTATTLMATEFIASGDAFFDAIRIAKETPSLDVGVHLVAVGSPGYPASIPALISAVARKRIKIYDEFAKQVRRVQDWGLSPTHLDTHKHTHLLPPVLDAVARVSEEFKIPWVRRPFDFPMQPGSAGVIKKLTAHAMSSMRGRFERVLTAHGCRSTDHFAGFKITGNYDARDLAALIRALPEGSTEFMCHPGRCSDELRSAKTRLKESREAELRALCSTEVREALDQSGVELATYRDLS